MSIIYEVTRLHIYNGYRSNDFLEEHMWGTAFAITKNSCLTKDWNKNMIGASIAASICKVISKNVS